MTDIEDLIAKLRTVGKTWQEFRVVSQSFDQAADALEAQQAKIRQLKAERHKVEMYLRLEREAARQNLERAVSAEAKIKAALECLWGHAHYEVSDQLDDIDHILSDASTETERTSHE